MRSIEGECLKHSSNIIIINCAFQGFTHPNNQIPYVYIIDQVRGQDGWILAEFSFCVFMDRDEVEVHKT